MPLTPGQRLGRYEIVKPLGAGGMGEVYRARDSRLDREVAIKILPESVGRDPERLARFEREAKAVAALSHPNILALHDAGTEQGTTYAVTELLEGETLRDRLNNGPLPVRKAVDAAIQIARGLTAAHAKGLVHRDLKPENVFLVADGQVKILDFGLAKTADPGDSAATATQMAQVAMTDPGTVLGTVGYMAPEQVRGHAIDARTDLFALGAVLYEMVAGERAFRRDTAAETMTAILREDVPDLPSPQSAQVPALDRIIRHCLEKNPVERFQSARDVVFALEALSGTTGASGSSGTSGARNELTPASSSASRTKAVAAALGFVVVAGAAAWATGYLHLGRGRATGAGMSEIAYQRVTFDEGFVFAGRFARDGRTIVYSADWENQRRDIFVTSIDNSGSRALGYKDADLLALAPDGALAILVDSTIPGGSPYGRRGTIARASLTGGAPRKELDRVHFADFAPDGSLAVIRGLVPAGAVLEWPQGKGIVQTNWGGGPANGLPNPRLSPAGTQVAYFACNVAGCAVTIADQSGKTQVQSRTYSDWWGLAWAPGGKEVWFAAVPDLSGAKVSVYALDLKGNERLLFRVPGALTLHDVSSEGRVLASFDQVTDRMEMRDSGAPRDLSWKEGGVLADVAPDGTVLFFEVGDSGGPAASAYIRRPDDPEPVRISDGVALAISDDGKTAVVRTASTPLKVLLVPTSGLAQPLDLGEFQGLSTARWLKDGRLVLQLVRKEGEKPVVYVRPVNGGAVTQFLPNGMYLTPRALSPDGQHISVYDDTNSYHLCDVPASGLATCKPLPGSESADRIAGWTADSGSLFVYRQYPTPIPIEKLNIATGKREPVMTLQPASAAVSGLRSLHITPSGALFYNYARNRSVLYAITGVK